VATGRQVYGGCASSATKPEWSFTPPIDYPGNGSSNNGPVTCQRLRATRSPPIELERRRDPPSDGDSARLARESFVCPVRTRDRVTNPVLDVRTCRDARRRRRITARRGETLTDR